MADILPLIGNTPLIEITRLNPHRTRSVRIFAKLECQNPGGSVKDRAAKSIILDGERRGELTTERALIDATSGNTGIAYAMICASRGYACHLVMPDNASAERKKTLRAFGATLHLTDPLEGQDGAIDTVRALVAKDPSVWFYADQYSNPANPQAHFETTGPEIWRQTHSEVSHFVAALGTTGTLVGTSRFLRGARDDVRVVALEPDGPMHGLEGLKHLASSHVPEIFDAKVADERRTVATGRAIDLTRGLAAEEGLLLGASSGAALAGALDVAADAPDGSTIVTIFPDGGGRYLSTRLFE